MSGGWCSLATYQGATSLCRVGGGSLEVTDTGIYSIEGRCLFNTSDCVVLIISIQRKKTKRDEQIPNPSL